MRIGCCLNMVASRPDGTGLEWIETLAQCGYDYAELPLAEMMGLSPSGFLTLVSRVEKSGLACEVCNNFFPKTMRLTGPDVDDAAVDTYVKAALGRAAALGVKFVVFGSGGAKQVPEGFPMEKGYEQVVALLRRVDEIAGMLGITIVIEPLRKAECNLINTFAEGCRLAEDVGGSHIRVLVDYYHLTEEREPLSHIVEGKEWLRHVHFANPAGRVFPSEASEADYEGFFRQLRAAGYDGRVSVEAYTDDFAVSAPISLRLLKDKIRESGH